MSSKPSMPGAYLAAMLIERARTLDNEVNELLAKTRRLEAAQEEQRLVRTTLWCLLENMDLTSTGNAGREGRVLYFLDAVCQQAAARERNQRPTLSIDEILALLDRASIGAKQLHENLKLIFDQKPPADVP